MSRVQPRQPEHADKIVTIPGADPRLTLKRVLSGYAYPRNGNFDNPTPRFDWLLLADGEVVDMAGSKGKLVEAARKDGRAYLGGDKRPVVL